VQAHAKKKVVVVLKFNVPKEESWKGVPSKLMLLNFALFAFNFALCSHLRGYKNM
jgi:hypothetical protein